MDYKYQKQLDEVRENLSEAWCPCFAAVPRHCRAYRLAYYPVAHPSDFLPRPLDANPPPPRAINIPVDATLQQILDEEHAQCDLWALSLFENPAAARKTQRRYSRSLRQTHIAEVGLTLKHGDCTPTDHKQHFNLHEFEGVQLHTSVLAIFPI